MSSLVKKQGVKSIENAIRTKLILGNKRKGLSGLRNLVFSLDVFFPFRELKKEKYQPKYKDYFMSGYAYIEYNSKLNYSILENTTYVYSFIRNGSNNQFEVLSKAHVDEEKAKMEKYFNNSFRVGQLVQVCGGVYSQLLGRIEGYCEEGDKYKITIFARSNIWKLELESKSLKVREEDLIVSDSKNNSGDLDI